MCSPNVDYPVLNGHDFHVREVKPIKIFLTASICIKKHQNISYTANFWKPNASLPKGETADPEIIPWKNAERGNVLLSAIYELFSAIVPCFARL